MIVSGEGDTRSVALKIQGTGKAGEMKAGHTGPINSAAFGNDKCFLVGDDKQVHCFKGKVLKYETSISGNFTNFINKAIMSADDQNVIAVSADKSVKVFNSDTHEVVIKAENVHSMGIQDVCQAEANILTSSSDKTVKAHGLDVGAGALNEIGVFTLNEKDAAGYKDAYMK